MSKEEAEMTIEEAIAEIKRKPTVRLWPTIAKLRGISKGAVYAAADRGEIDFIQNGRTQAGSFRQRTTQARHRISNEGRGM